MLTFTTYTSHVSYQVRIRNWIQISLRSARTGDMTLMRKYIQQLLTARIINCNLHGESFMLLHVKLLPECDILSCCSQISLTKLVFDCTP